MWATVSKAVPIFVVTNIDDLLLVTLFFGIAGRNRAAAARIIIGQYAGFAGILGLSFLGAYGAQQLLASTIPYLGLLPVGLGFLGAWKLWRRRRNASDRDPDPPSPGLLTVTTVTLAKGADNISVYIPLFAAESAEQVMTYSLVFLVLLAIWCATGRYIATRPAVTKHLATSGELLVPAALIAVGLIMLVEQGAFGL